jgi:hypothetical protein
VRFISNALQRAYLPCVFCKAHGKEKTHGKQALCRAHGKEWDPAHVKLYMHQHTFVINDWDPAAAARCLNIYIA